MSFGKDIIIIGIILVITGVVISFFHLTSLPKLPGDILIKKGNFTFYFPWVTSIIISIVLSLAFYLFFRH